MSFYKDQDRTQGRRSGIGTVVFETSGLFFRVYDCMDKLQPVMLVHQCWIRRQPLPATAALACN